MDTNHKRINFFGKVVEEPEIRAGFIGCGSHSFRNIFPTFQFAPVNLVATCDLDIEKAQAYAARFGAGSAYSNYHEMIEKENLDAVFIVTGGDDKLRPLYPGITIDCLRAGVNVWLEKPPAATCAEIEAMMQAAESSGKHAMVGFKKMFYPAIEKARELMDSAEFGQVALAAFEYPQWIPSVKDFRLYFDEFHPNFPVGMFLDHICHPVSEMLYLLGMPSAFSYECAHNGSGAAIFTFESGVVATLMMTHGSARNMGMERTKLISNKDTHIIVDNNIRVSLHRDTPCGYGCSPSYFAGTLDNGVVMWEPEFSLGQLYNKGLFLIGYYGEINEFARSILDKRPPAKAHLEHAWQATHIFEAFAEGPGKRIELRKNSRS